MQLGAFSISLAVRNIAASQDFCEKLGFTVIGGDAAQNWLILRNPDDVTIGLFQGLFDRNLLTFNPGWDRRCGPLQRFDDVREIQQRLEPSGLRLDSGADSTTRGPASITLADPDGNPVLIGKHL